MSIFDQTGQEVTITEGWQALKLFTNRHQAIRHFSAYINDDPPREQILFFCGDGGNGKTLLLQYLKKYHCKPIYPNGGSEPVPSALIDFGMPPRGENRPQEAFSALLMLRRQLSGYDLHFPLYDFACVWYLHKTSQLTQDRLRNLFPVEAMDLVVEFVNLIEQIPGVGLGKVVLNALNNKLRERFTLYMKRRKIDENLVEEIQRMDPELELVNELPNLFAKDLNTAISLEKAPEKIVVFFDTYEAFWRDQRDLSDDLYFARDEWLRRFLGTLRLGEGIIVILAGRNRPRWAQASKWEIPDEYIDTQQIGHLLDSDAETYLKKAGIAKIELRQALIAYAQIAPNQVHPLYLGLCADLALAAGKRGTTLRPADFKKEQQLTTKEKTLTDRLLRYVGTEVEHAVRALCACRAFNWEIYQALGKSLNFHATEPGFNALTQFSFIWHAEDHAEGWYRIHEIVKRLAPKQARGGIVRRAHQALEKFYLQRVESGDLNAIAEVLYHSNRINWKESVEAWVSTFERFQALSQYNLCRALLDVSREMTIETDFERGRVAQCEGDYLTIFAQYNQARAEYIEAIAAFDIVLGQSPKNESAHHNRGNALRSLGDLQVMLAEYRVALENYQHAINAFDETLKYAPRHVNPHISKGRALRSLGDLQAQFSDYDTATQSYRRAIAAYDKVLRLNPDNRNAVLSHTNKANALNVLGHVQAKLSQYDAANESYQHAISTLDQALRLDPDDISARVSKAGALFGLAEFKSKLSQHDAALKSYHESVAAFDSVLQLAPNDPRVRTNKASALVSLGEMQATHADYGAATECYQSAITDLDGALQLSPGDPRVYNNLAAVLLSIADLEVKRSEYDTARENYSKAIATCDVALQLASDQVMTYRNKGQGLRSLGDLNTISSEYKAAQESYQQAIATFDKALTIAPDDVFIYHDQGYVLRRLGALQVRQSKYKAARESYQQAIATFDKALTIAPDDVFIHNDKGNALTGLGDFQDRLSKYEAAQKSYQQAIDTFDTALTIAPDDHAAYNNKGLALRSLGDLQASHSQHDAAVNSYQSAIAVLQRAHDLVEAHNNRGTVLQKLGDLQSKRSEYEVAAQSYQSAIAAYEGQRGQVFILDRIRSSVKNEDLTPRFSL